MNCFIDEGCKAFSIVEDELFFMYKEGLWVRVRLGTKWDRLNWTTTSLSDQDGGILVFHVDAIKGSWVLFITIKKGKLGKFK
jgi:hypothetical protein